MPRSSRKKRAAEDKHEPDPKVEAETGAELSWTTTEHHLIGKSVTRSMLCPLDSTPTTTTQDASSSSPNNDKATTIQPQHYQQRFNPARTVAFQPEYPPDRKPALWRALIAGSISAPTLATELGTSKTGAMTATTTVCRAADFVAADWKEEDESGTTTSSSVVRTAVPTPTAVAVVKSRVDSLVYQTVLDKMLPSLVLAAAVEECQAQFVQQQVALQQQQQPSAATMESSSASSYSNTPYPYYKQTPSSYLTAPSATNNAAGGSDGLDPDDVARQNTTLPFQFTPSTLVHRIKQGCALVWQDFERHFPKPPPPTPPPTLAVASSSATATMDEQLQTALQRRRLSSRVQQKQVAAAEQQQLQQLQQQQVKHQNKLVPAQAATELSPRWKVVPGGMIATRLKQQLVLVETTTTEEEGDTKAEEEQYPVSREDGTGEKQELNHEKAKSEETPAADPTGQDSQSAEQGENQEKAETGQEEENAVADDNGDITMLVDDDEEEEASLDEKSGDDDYAPDGNNDEEEDDEEDTAGEYVKEKADILDVEMNEEPGDGNEDDDKEEGDEEEVDEEEEEDDVDLVLDDNPYLQPEGPAVLEWLGRKTAKHLSSVDIQTAFPSMMPPKLKKKSKKKATVFTAKQMAEVGGDALDYLSPTDQLIWSRMLPHGSDMVGAGARIFLQIVNDEDTSAIDEWEAPAFGRSLFAMRIWNGQAEEEIDQRAYDEYAVAEMEYKDKKAWASWRYKGINGGYTVWPSWLEAVDAWRKNHGPAALPGSIEQDQEDSKQPGDATAEDHALAQSLAEQDVPSAAGTRRSRRSADSGAGGLFYGSQSNMTQKQLMDAILRLVSQNAYQTAMGLVASVSDDSTDPLRRIRAALGKLLCKRNQLARMTVQPSWSDAPVWEALRDRALTTVDEGKEKRLAVSCASDQKEALLNYIKSLHNTELRLRQMVLEHLGDIPIGIVATSADESPGKMESMDDEDYEDTESIEWHTSGHDLLGKVIYRPPTSSHSDEIVPCEWFRVQDFSDPVASTAEDGDVPERPQIGSAKEATAVERRSRFRASTTSPTDGGSGSANGTVLLLTEAQVHAGLKAAEMEKKRASSPQSYRDNPFVGSKAQISLVPPENSSASLLSVSVVGHDSILDSDNVFHHRVLLLPDEGNSQDGAVWARLAFPESGSTECQIEGNPVVYTLQQNDYHSSSQAFQECRNIVNFSMRHSKAGPFLEPVDPVALNVPDYPKVIKNPMDLSTLSNNLESGKYSNIPPKQAKGRTATARMLNGPFGNDLELIFDNAMLFNPPDDWIHQAAAALKKAVMRKVDQAINSAENKSSGRAREKQSVYVDEDSDVDMYEYESDQDEDYNANGRNRKRKHSSSRTPIKEDSSARSIERPIRLQKVLSGSMGLRGPLANIPVNTDPSTFTLPHGWSCRRTKGEVTPSTETPHRPELDRELDDLIALHRAMQESEASGLRRSTRTHHVDTGGDSSNGGQMKGQVEYFPINNLDVSSLMGDEKPLPRNRVQVELARETMHEEYYAKVYHKMHKALGSSQGTSIGSFCDGSFPPYLGRVVPTETSPEPSGTDVQGSPVAKWEIREAYLVPALRWVLRGLIRSNHLSELEPVDAGTDNGVIIPNHVYYLDPDAEPFAVVDVRELTRRKKRANDAAVAESSDEEVELSAYEQMRAERVARNAERLKALGLA